jgi:Gpi18-like mannosyltransferase
VTERTRDAIRYSLTVFIIVRLGLFLLGLATVAVVVPVEPVDVPGWPAGDLPDPGLHNVFTAWERFDALWFLRIAEGGYIDGDGSAAFFPAFPLLIRAVSFVIGGHPFAAAMIVSNIAFAAALCVLYLLTAEERSVDTARTTVLLLGAGPASLFFYAPYSEALFLLFAVVAFRSARHRSWALAGGAALLGALTRSIGVVIAAAIAIEAIHQWLEGRRGSLLPGLAAAVAGGLTGSRRSTSRPHGSAASDGHGRRCSTRRFERTGTSARRTAGTGFSTGCSWCPSSPPPCT